MFPRSEEEPSGEGASATPFLPDFTCKIGKETEGVMVNKADFEGEMECRPEERQKQLMVLECNC